MDIPGYKIVRPLGKGGMATVYLAIQEKFDREVALKVMSPQLSSDPSFCERFMREAKIVAKISHPNIVAVYDVNEHEGLYFIAMEYHPGGDLKARIRAGLPPKEAFRIAREVAKALDYAHGKGYIHRDIKPDNVLFRADGSAVLTDFGIARTIEGDVGLTQMGTVAGTPKYMSPEQARGQALDGASDLYSLGVMLYEMLTGHVPFEATDPIALGIMHLNSPVPRLQGALAHFQPLIDRMMAKNPVERPQSGAVVVREIDALESSFDYEAMNSVAGSDDATLFRPSIPAGSAKAAVARKPASVKSSRGPSTGILVAAVVAVSLAGGGVAGWLGKKPSEPIVASVSQSAPASVSAVASLLGKAREQMASGAWLEPAGANARDSFREVLRQEPANQEALNGLTELVVKLQDRGFQSLKEGDIAGAERWARDAVDVVPEHPANQELQNAIAAAKAEAGSASKEAKSVAKLTTRKKEPVHEKAAPREVAVAPAVPLDPKAEMLRRLRVQGLISSGNAALEENNVSLAQEKFRAALALDAENKEAREGLHRAQAK